MYAPTRYRIAAKSSLAPLLDDHPVRKAIAPSCAETFVAQLDDQELAVLRSALDKVVVDCTFG